MRNNDEDAHWCSRAEAVRGTLVLNQQSFASLLGVNMSSVRRWKNGHQSPDQFGKLLIELLESVLDTHSRTIVIESLRKVHAEPLPVVRMLTWLDAHARTSEAIPADAIAPPSWITRCTAGEEGESPCERVRRLRCALGVSQQELATLIGFSFSIVCRWQRSLADPANLGQLTLELLSNAVKGHAAQTIVLALREAGSRRADIARTLTWLERYPTLPEPRARPRRASTPPPFDSELLPSSTSWGGSRRS